MQSKSSHSPTKMTERHNWINYKFTLKSHIRHKGLSKCSDSKSLAPRSQCICCLSTQHILVVVIVTPRLLHGDMLAIYCPYSMGDIPSCSEIFLHFFPVFRVSDQAQILFLEFIKDGLADLGDEFTYGGLSNQPAILQGCCVLLPGVSVLLPVSVLLLTAS